MPWVASPCSPSDSPWSAVRTTSGPAGAARREDRLQQRAGARRRRPRPRRGRGATRSATAKGSGGAYGAVRLVEVHPAERRAPALRRRSRPARAPPSPSPRRSCSSSTGRACGVDEAVVVDVEAAREAEARVERKGAHEGRRSGSRAPSSSVASVSVPDGKRKPALSRTPCSSGQAAGEDVRVRGERHDVVRVGVVEAHARARPAGRSTAWRRRLLPYAPSASARSVSMVTSRTLRPASRSRPDPGRSTIATAVASDPSASSRARSREVDRR